MAWARLDDGFYDHPKILALWGESPAAVGLHVRCLAYATKHLTDGVLPEPVVRAMGADNEMLGALVNAGLWYELEGGQFGLHDFLDWNPSRDEVRERKAKDRERKRG